MSKKCACQNQSQIKILSEKMDLILEKLESIELSQQSQSLQLVRQPAEQPSEQPSEHHVDVNKSSKEKEDDNSINGFFANKEQMIKDEVRKFMLTNFNIEQLADDIEGDIYDFIVEKIWDLTVGRFI